MKFKVSLKWTQWTWGVGWGAREEKGMPFSYFGIWFGPALLYWHWNHAYPDLIK